jgi:hypothetical protein
MNGPGTLTIDLACRLAHRWHEPAAHLPRRRITDVAAVVPDGQWIVFGTGSCEPRDRACSHHDVADGSGARSPPTGLAIRGFQLVTDGKQVVFRF